MVAPLYTAVLLVGLGHHPAGPGCCDVCGIKTASVAAEISRLQTCPRWRDRDRAAHALRKVDWRCHPEVVDALAFALLHDCDEEVREEAAESLAKLAPCVPVAHEALSAAALSDPDRATSRWARRALAQLGRRCEGACAVCGPGLALPPVSAPAPAVVEPLPPALDEPALAPLSPTSVSPAPLPSPPLPEPMPPAAGELRLEPPADMPPAATGVAPFAPEASTRVRPTTEREATVARRLPPPPPPSQLQPLRPLRRAIRMIPQPALVPLRITRALIGGREPGRPRFENRDRLELDRDSDSELDRGRPEPAQDATATAARLGR